jgi:hypothetical protein
VLGVDERRDAAGLLGVGDGVQRYGRFARALRSVDLDDAPARQAADAQGDVEGDRAGRDDLDRRPDVVAETHHGALAELAVDLCQRGVERLVAVLRRSHVCRPG